MNNKVYVSICMITYNQAEYISQAIESVIMQNTKYSFELVIGEDFSSDTTRQICEEYAYKYPSKIKLLPSTKNLGMIQNLFRTLNSCSGKYIAFCEGDDYWINKNKLEEQVTYMENHSDCSICTTLRYDLFPDGSTVKQKINKYHTKESKLIDLINSNFLNTISVMIRSENLPLKTPKWFEKLKFGDYLLWILTTKNGKIHTILDYMTVYRFNNGVSKLLLNKKVFLKNNLYFYLHLFTISLPLNCRFLLLKKVMIQLWLILKLTMKHEKYIFTC